MPFFERDGLAFHYLDEGDPSGRPFVFQHSLGGDVSQPAGVFSPAAPEEATRRWASPYPS
jgi:hypothetical protein